MDLAKAVQVIRKLKTVLENSPVRDSQSTGLAEKGIQEIAGQVRVIKFSMEAAYQCKIPIDHPIMPWLVEWAPATLDYFSVGRDGKTSYEKHTGKRFKLGMAEFGENVQFKVQTRKKHEKRQIKAKVGDWNIPRGNQEIA